MSLSLMRQREHCKLPLRLPEFRLSAARPPSADESMAWMQTRALQSWPPQRRRCSPLPPAYPANVCRNMTFASASKGAGKMDSRGPRKCVTSIKFPDFTVKNRLSAQTISLLNHRPCVTTCRRRRRMTPPWRAPAAPCAHPNLSWGLPAASWLCSRCCRRPPRPRLRSASRTMKIKRTARATHTGTAARVGSWRLTNSSLLSQNFTVWSWPTLAMNARSNVLRHFDVSGEKAEVRGGQATCTGAPQENRRAPPARRPECWDGC